MSLLTDASLILTPNAYNKDKLYSVIPNTTLGDMAVTRGSSATRVNSAKLIEIARTNLVLQSQTFTNVYWTQTNVTVTADTTTAPDGTTTADTVLANGVSSAHTVASDVISFTAGTSYSLSVFVKKGTNDFVQLFVGAGIGGMYANFNINTGAIGTVGTVGGNVPTSSITNFGGGWYRCIMNFTANLTNIVPAKFVIVTSATASREESNTLTTSVILWGAQLETSNIAVATEYIPTIASIRTKFAGITQDGGFALNIPRIDYPPLGGCPSILVEPARTNEVLYSEEFNDLSWNKSDATISANATNSPSGNLTADKLIEGTLNGFHYVNRNITNSNSLFTFSVFAKKSERNFLYLQAFATIPNNFAYTPSAYFDLNNGTVGTVNTATASIQDYGNGWYRCTLNCTSIFPQTSASVGMYIMTATSNLNSSYLGNGTSGIFIWGAQAEIGSYATSYIPTTTAAVPRAAELISRNNIYTNGLLSASGGTWFMELRNNFVYTRDNTSVNINLDASSGFTNGFLLRNLGVGRLSIQKTISGNATSLYLTTADTSKIAIKWNGATADVFDNGTKVVTATAFTTTQLQSILTQMQVPVFINQMALWATPLSDDQCILLTGPSFSSYVEMANNFPNTLIYSLQ